MGAALPGRDSVPGHVLSNRDLYKQLYSRWKRAGIYLRPKKRRKLEKFITGFERRTGIKERSWFVGLKNPYQTEMLATLAGVNLLDKATFHPENVEGFIFITNTPDTLFPPPGRITAKALGIKPYRFANCMMGCASIVHALEIATMWLEKKQCKNVLIIASDLTSRLKQDKTTFLQSWIFADAASAILLEGTDAPGGFQISFQPVNMEVADIEHRIVCSGDPSYVRKQQVRCGVSNDESLKSFASSETAAIPNLVSYLRASLGRPFNSNDRLVPPQIGKNVVDPGMAKLGDGIKAEIKDRVVRSPVPVQGNTGAAATPLAWWYASKTGEIQPGNVVSTLMYGLGGLSAIVTYDPNLSEEENGIGGCETAIVGDRSRNGDTLVVEAATEVQRALKI